MAVSITGKQGVAYPDRAEAWDASSLSWTGQGAFDTAPRSRSDYAVRLAMVSAATARPYRIGTAP